VRQDALDHVRVVVDAELIRDGQHQRVGGLDRRVLGELSDEHVRLGGIRPAEDRPGLGVQVADVVLLFAAPLAKYVPLAVLAAILLVVSYNMGEWGQTAKLLKLSKSDISIWLMTFALTVLADLTVAVEFGMILAALLFIRKVAVTTTVQVVTDDYVEAGHAHILQGKDIPDYVSIFRIHGPFLFGATEKLELVSEQLDSLPAVVILRLRNMTALDATGLHAIESLAEKLHASGRTLILCGAREQPVELMAQAEFEQRVGRENICENVETALDRAREVYGQANAAVG